MQPGFCIIHANHLETLADIAIQHCRNEPLGVLDKEVVLVQSNGMADWFKLKQAAATGISASMEFPMPASFLWQMYQQVLDGELIDRASPFAKDSLQWRLLRLLPDLLEQPEFARPSHFLAQDSGHTKCFQLAQKLADLFDQYQLYRAEWITAWESGKLLGLGPDEAWQASLWRAIIDDLPAPERLRSRAHLHAAFLKALEGDTPQGLPKRLYLFGISSMPKQLLEALYAMSRHSQLLLMILSPCQEYWGDKGSPALENFAATNPLLDSWGEQGRDFLRLLQDYQPDASALQHTQEINPYADASSLTRGDSMICHLQQAILDNRLPDEKQPLPARPGLYFYPCYSRQREVEILHDKLLELFANNSDLGYSDLVVMMPDVDIYAPHIEAVFNRYDYSDSRHLAFSISDRHQHDLPFYQALDYLLGLPDARLTLSEVVSLLQVESVRKCAAIDADDLEQLSHWIHDSHIHWGLNGRHKQQLLQLSNEEDSDWRGRNSWQAGIDQLLAGYCAGDQALFADSVNLDEVSGNQGVLLGQLAAFIERLDVFRKRLSAQQSPSGWQHTFDDLLSNFFSVETDDDRLLLGQLNNALDAWLGDCELAAFNALLPLSQARQGWQNKLSSNGLSQQLSFNGITFCTLMPMRALPFKQVFLLGMNDGAYPHETQIMDFDLMCKAYQPGDRNRRDDDQYLFLEALMSVRDSLHISWVGRDIKRGVDIPPCTLVGQLRDLIERCWQSDSGGSACDILTTVHPLAAFSKSYFVAAANGPSPTTYAHEWLVLHQPPRQDTPLKNDTASPDRDHTTTPLTDWQLAALLKAPIDIFYRDRLKVHFVELQETSADDEPFSLNNLERWGLRNHLLQALLHNEDGGLDHWRCNGALPVGGFGEAALAVEHTTAASIQRRWQEKLDAAHACEPRDLCLSLNTHEHSYRLQTSLDPLWETPAGLLQAIPTASNIQHKLGWKFDKLALCWVRHLAASAQGLKLSSLVVARDKRVELAPLPPHLAQQLLERLLLVYHHAWQQPLPFAKGQLMLDKKAPDLGLDELTESELLTRLQQHWPADNSDAAREQALPFFADLLYRPLLQALDSATQTRKQEPAS